MSETQGKVSKRKVAFVVLLCLVVLLYYTDILSEMKISLARVVGGDFQVSTTAILEDKNYSRKEDLKPTESSVRTLQTQSPSTQSRTLSYSANPCSTFNASNNSHVSLDWLRFQIMNKTTCPLLTLFTTWRNESEKHLMHSLTLRNWLSLKPFVIPIVFTNETLVAAECEKGGVQVLPVSVAAADDVPVLKFMFRDVMASYNSTFYAYSNSDILFTDTLLDTLFQLVMSGLNLTIPVLIVGQRTNVDNVTEIDASTWKNITIIAKDRGELFTTWAEDFFISSGSFPWQDIAEVVIGRRAYDNWLVYYSRKAGFTVIDATKTILGVHQTLKAGNFEGFHHKHRDYNDNLLVKLYKDIQYQKGLVECTSLYTVYDNVTVTLKSRPGCPV